MSAGAAVSISLKKIGMIHMISGLDQAFTGHAIAFQLARLAVLYQGHDRGRCKGDDDQTRGGETQTGTPSGRTYLGAPARYLPYRD